MRSDLPVASLSELAEVNPHRSMNGLAPDAEVSFVSMPDVSETGEITNRRTRKLREVLSGYTNFLEGDVLFAKITPCMENGKGCHAIGLTNSVGFGSTEFHVLRAGSEADSRYLYHWSLAAPLRKQAEAFMIGSAGQQRVQAEFFDHYRVPRLPLAEQRRIAEILDTLDAAIRRAEQVIAKLRLMKQGLLHDLLTCGIDDNGELRDPERHPEQFKDSALGRLPRSWQVNPLSGLASVASGVTLGRKLSDAGTIEVPYLRVANVQDGFVDTAEMKTVRILPSELSRYALEPNDVVMTEGGDFDKLGRGALWDGRISPCLHQNHIFRVRCVAHELMPEYLAFLSGSQFGKSYFLRSSKQTTNLASINSTQLKAFPVLLPPVQEQQAITEAIAAHNRLEEAEQQQLSKLRVLKAGLADDLLTGRIRVPVPKEATP